MKRIGLALCVALSLIPLSVSKSQTQDAYASQVTIRRDTYGVPHILGKTEEAASFGLGYAQAEDHAVEIAQRLVAARGEQAKYFGRGADTDLLLKQFDNYEVCRAHFRDLDPLMQRIYQAYIAGVNHYIARHRAELPEWIPVFNEIDVMAHIRQGSVTAVRGVIGNLRRKYEPQSTADPGDDAFDDTGSNAFAIGPSRTTSRKAILLGNPHLSWSSLYWEAHLTVPGKLNFFGSTLPAYPVLRAGFNERLGWVTTNDAPDMADVFSLRLDPERADHYIFEGKSLPLNRRDVAVEVKNPDGSFTTQKQTVEDSHIGIIIYRTKDHAFAYRSTQLESFRHFEGFYRLSKARNLKQWMAVMDLNLTNYSNFTYADADGNILYLSDGHLPKRVDDGTSYELDVPAETATYLWKGLHPVADLPKLLNPSGGYTQNCNNPPWFPSLRDPIDSSKYPSYFEKGDLALRPQLALEMLESQPKFSLDDVKQLKYNTKMLLADRLKPDLVAAVRSATESGASEDLKKGLAVIEAWGNRASAEAKGAVLFQRFADTYLDAAKKPYRVDWDPANPGKTPFGIADSALAVRHFEDAVKWTRQKYGREDVEWGAVHRFRFKDVDIPAEGASGKYGAFRVMGFNEMPDGKRVAGWTSDDAPLSGSGDGWVLAVEFAKPVKAFSVVAYGQTTNSNSRHSRDQIELFANHKYKPVWFSEAQIRANLEREYRP
jgi:acyl-homoserine-lactone acylase